MKLDEAAYRTGVSRALLMKAIKEGRLRAQKQLDEGDWSPNPKWYVEERDLEEYLGKKLLPRIPDLQQQLAGVQERLELAASRLNNSPQQALEDLRFTIQWVLDLRVRLNHGEQPVELNIFRDPRLPD